MAWDSRIFEQMAEAENRINRPFDEAFMSVLEVRGETVFIEHNELFSQDEFSSMEQRVSNEIANWIKTMMPQSE